MKLNIIINSGISCDGFDTIITDGDRTFKKSYAYGYDCSYDRLFANSIQPYVTDLLQGVIDKYHVTEVSVEAGKNKFTGEDVKSSTVEKFKNKYCTELQMYDAKPDVADENKEDDFCKAVAGISENNIVMEQ